MTGRQIHTGLLRISILFFFLLLSFWGVSQKRLGFYIGAGPNTSFCQYLRSELIDGVSKGILSVTGNAAVKLKLSRHFSISAQYTRIRSRINVSMKDIEVYYFDRYTQQGKIIGYMSFKDELYLFGNQVGLNFNYEMPFEKNTLIVGLGINSAFYSSGQNKIIRNYESLPNNSAISDIDRRQSSELAGPNLISPGLSLTYERTIFSDRVGVFGRLEYNYNIEAYSFNYKCSNMGLVDGYEYRDKRGAVSAFKYYSFSFQTLNFTIGAFINLNFKANEKSSTN